MHSDMLQLQCAPLNMHLSQIPSQKVSLLIIASSQSHLFFPSLSIYLFPPLSPTPPLMSILIVVFSIFDSVPHLPHIWAVPYWFSELDASQIMADHNCEIYLNISLGYRLSISIVFGCCSFKMLCMGAFVENKRCGCMHLHNTLSACNLTASAECGLRKLPDHQHIAIKLACEKCQWLGQLMHKQIPSTSKISNIINRLSRQNCFGWIFKNSQRFPYLLGNKRLLYAGGLRLIGSYAYHQLIMYVSLPPSNRPRFSDLWFCQIKPAYNAQCAMQRHQNLVIST